MLSSVTGWHVIYYCDLEAADQHFSQTKVHTFTFSAVMPEAHEDLAFLY
jgi:hypothetical protein